MLLFAPSLTSLFFFSGFAVAGLVGPDCTEAALQWSSNSLGQNACVIAAYMMSTCHAGSFTVQALQPGYHYSGPTASQGTDQCMCNTIAYSLLSACDACQGTSDWLDWPDYSKNCTKVLPPGSFPNPIPAGTRLPRWALIDVTADNNWNANFSKAVGGNPELGPGTILSPSASSSTAPTSAYPFTPISRSSSSTSSSSSNSATPIPIRGSSNTGAIAGGVAGSIGGISILGAALLVYLRRRQRRRPQSAQPAASISSGYPSGFDPLMDQVPRSMSGQGTVTSSVPETTTASMTRPYSQVYDAPSPDSGRSAMYPAHQAKSPPPGYLIGSPSPTSSRNIYTVATAPDLQGQGPGHHIV